MSHSQKYSVKNGYKWRAFVCFKGVKKNKSGFNKKKDSDEYIRKCEQEIRTRLKEQPKLNQDAESPKQEKTLNDLIDKFVNDYLPSQKNLKETRDKTHRLNWWKREIGDTKLTDVDAVLIRKCKRKLEVEKVPIRYNAKTLDVRKPDTIRNYLLALSRCFSIALEEFNSKAEHWVDSNPVLNVKKPKPQKRERVLTIEEIKRFLNACQNSRNKFLLPIVVCLLFTGSRKKEIVALRWSEINFENGYICLIGKRTKNGKPKRITLGELPLGLLKELYERRRADTDYVFPSRPGSRTPHIHIRKAFESALRKSDIQGVHLHTLRHSAATIMICNNVDIAEASKILGHSSIKITAERYVHLAEDFASKAARNFQNGFAAKYGITLKNELPEDEREEMNELEQAA